MRQLAITFAVTMLIAYVGALASNAQAATFAGVGSLPPLVQGYSPIETVRCVVDRVDAPAADAIGFGVAGGTEAAGFAAGGGNKLRCRFHLQGA
jgi:hypothetical protein